MSNSLAAATTATPQASAPPNAHALPPELAFLQGLAPDQRFDAFVGGQFTIRDPQGKDVIVNAVPGRVTALTANSVTITPNQSAQSRTFNVTATTRIKGTPHPGSLSVFSVGDRVMVFVVGNSSDAMAIVEHHGGMGRMHHPAAGNQSAAAPTPTASQ